MNFNRQILNLFIVIIGAALLLYELATEGDNLYLKIGGLILLMYGLYTATKQWTAENREEETEFEEDEE